MTSSGLIEPRQVLGRFLRGHGLEIGPGENPYPLVFGGAAALRVDQWGAEDAAGLFREVDSDRFRDPDHQVDLNVERLSAFPDGSQDFVIASHVLEHLVEPIGQLRDIWRVLRPGGVLLLLLPDRRRTFDRDREATTLDHLVEEYERGVTELDDAHLAEFTQAVPADWGDAPPPRDQAELFERHRRRSIHVHCWTEAEFADVVAYTIEHLDTPWELLDRLGSEDVRGSIEFGLVLRRPALQVPASEAAERFRRVLAALTTYAAAHRAAADAEPAQQKLDVRARVLEKARSSLREHERLLRALRRLHLDTLVRHFRRARGA